MANLKLTAQKASLQVESVKREIASISDDLKRLNSTLDKLHYQLNEILNS